MLLNCGAGEDSWESLGLQRLHLKGNQSWIFIRRTDAEAETPILWPPNGKNRLIWKDPDAGKDWRWEEKGMTGWTSVEFKCSLKPRCLLNHLTSTCDCFNVLLPTSCKFLFPTHSRHYRLWIITMVERHLFSRRFSGRCLPRLDWVSPVFHLPAPTLAGTGVCMEWALD